MTITVEKEIRVDKFISEYLSESRNQVEKLIADGNISINGKISKKRGLKLKIDDVINIVFPEKESVDSEYSVNFDVPVLYEDDYLLVVNKPAGVVVHSAPSVKEATLVDWLKNRGVSLSTLNGEERHGIVHRLDKWTTGAMVIAKDNQTHQKLSEQLQDRSMGRYYLAIVNQPLKESTVIDKPIARNPKDRLKMAIVDGGKSAKTEFRKFKESLNSREELLFCKLFTGRTHQIRVHLQALHRYILGDSLYSFKSKKDNIESIFLHAYILYLIHPETGKKLQVEAPLYSPMRDYIKSNFGMELKYEDIQEIYNL